MPKRRLPHIYPPNRWLFLTWCLHGALPPSHFPLPSNTQSAGQAFVYIDRYLDKAEDGPLYLTQPPIAQLVQQALTQGATLQHYQLGPYVLMPNHVHVLLLPQISPTKLLKSLKGYTARQSNRLLNRTGNHFWQNESYDHWVRDQDEWTRIAKYIEQNPVTAGLAKTADQYPWSSAANPTQIL